MNYSNWTISILLTYVFIFTNFAVLAQGLDSRNTFHTDSLKTKLRLSEPDTNRINLLLFLADPFAVVNEKSYNLDTALFYTRQADSLSSILKFNKGLILGKLYLASILAQKGKTKKAKDMLLEGIKMLKKRGYNRHGVEGWYTIRDAYMVSQEQLAEVMLWYKQALTVSHKMENKQIEADILKEIAFIYYQQGKHILGVNVLQKVLTIYDSINNPKLHYIYDLFSIIHQNMGNYPEALKFSLATLKSAQNTSDTTHIANFYIRLGMIYRDLKMMESSLKCFKSALMHAQATHQKLVAFEALSLVSRTLGMMGKKEEGLAIVLKKIKIYPPKDETSKIVVSEILANCYFVLKQYPLAEKYFIEMLNYQEKRPQDDLYKMIVMQKTSLLYLEMKDFSKSEQYLQQAIKLNHKLKSTQSAITQQLLIFKLDSAQGNFQEAIGHYQLYKALEDSIFNEAKSKEIARMEVQFESEKKEKDLLLKEQSIKALTKENLLQEEKMKQDQIILNVIIGGAILVLLLLALLYNRYRLKQKSNKLLQGQGATLQKQQKLIQEKSQTLEHLIVEKEQMLTEIHNRVKNNLQIVMNLLNSQVASLQGKAALSAIQDSRNRIQAMALIHQKLYQTEGLARIPMISYVEEVVANLQNTYALPLKIHFKMLIDPIELDVNIAVPLGLILNEAITNAFKYAFPEERSGLIKVCLRRKAATMYEFTFEDDGVGLPKGYDPSQSESLGMTLIHGFSAQLGGELTIENSHGVKLSLIFSEEKLSSIYTKLDYLS